jgi:hypothetical protein
MPPKPSRKMLPQMLVSEKDMAQAQALLQGAEEAKRQRSNMTYWLKSEGLDKPYQDAPQGEKRKFLAQWFASRLATSGTSTTTHAVVSNSTKERNFEWCGKQALITKLGEHKASAKINSGNMTKRPDPDTGLEGEWDLEYKLFSDTGGNQENDNYTHGLTAEKEFNGDDSANEARASLQSMADNMGNNVNPLFVKTEEGVVLPSSMASSSSSNKLLQAAQNDKTFMLLKETPRQVLRNMNETITTLKEMFEKTKGGKYQEQLHEDIKKCIPLFITQHKKVETVCVQGGKEEVELKALAINVDKVFERYNDVEEWYIKFHHVPKDGKKRKRAQ